MSISEASETNGHLPNGYYVERKGSGRRVLFSPYLIPKENKNLGIMVGGTDPRPVASWSNSEAVDDALIHEIANFDADAMSKSPARGLALEELAIIFKSEAQEGS